MTQIEALQRILDMLDRAMDLYEQVAWDDPDLVPDDPDEEEYEDPDLTTATPVYAIGGGKAA